MTQRAKQTKTDLFRNETDAVDKSKGGETGVNLFVSEFIFVLTSGETKLEGKQGGNIILMGSVIRLCWFWLLTSFISSFPTTVKMSVSPRTSFWCLNTLVEAPGIIFLCTTGFKFVFCLFIRNCSALMLKTEEERRVFLPVRKGCSSSYCASKFQHEHGGIELVSISWAVWEDNLITMLKLDCL